MTNGGNGVKVDYDEVYIADDAALFGGKPPSSVKTPSLDNGRTVCNRTELNIILHPH